MLSSTSTLCSAKSFSNTFPMCSRKSAKRSFMPGADAEGHDGYAAENVFWINKIARWSYLQGGAKHIELLPVKVLVLDEATRSEGRT